MVHRENTSDTASMFGIIGGGTAQVDWTDSVSEGACTQKLNDGEWLVTLPKDDEIVKLHEASHVKWSSFESTAVYRKLDTLGRELFAILEDSRIDTLGTDWYKRDLFGDHGARLAKDYADSEFPKNSMGELVRDVTSLAYDILPMPLSDRGLGILGRFMDRIENVRTDNDPWSSARLALDIASAYPPEPEPESPEPESPDGGSDSGGSDSGDSDSGDSDSGDSGSGDSGSGDSGEPEPETPEPEPEPESEPDVGGVPDMGGDIASDDAWRRIQRQAKSDARTMRRKAKEQAHKDDIDAPVHIENTHIIEHDQFIPVELSEQAQILMDSLESHGTPTKDTVGAVTTDVWRMGMGDMRVFEQRPRRRGKAVIYVDYSGSMYNPNFQGNNGWLAMQVAGAVGLATDAEVFAYSGSSSRLDICKMPVGEMAVRTTRDIREDETSNMPMWMRDDPTHLALDHLGKHLLGELGDTLGVIITDGLTYWDELKPVAKRLLERGGRFVVVVVGVQAYRVADRYAEVFRNTPVVIIAEPDDIPQLGELIDGALDR